ncbi:MAG: hypothetical protein WDA65_00990 [Christensenellales bacterium]
MTKNRKVGTLTAGVSMIVFGFLFMIRLAIPSVTFRLIASLWPLILILLGIEVIIAYVRNKEGQVKYSACSVVIIITLTFFAIVMAAVQIALENELWLI